MSEREQARRKLREERGLGFKTKIKPCAGGGHMVCRCSDRHRRAEIMAGVRT